MNSNCLLVKVSGVIRFESNSEVYEDPDQATPDQATPDQATPDQTQASLILYCFVVEGNQIGDVKL